MRHFITVKGVASVLFFTHFHIQNFPNCVCACVTVCVCVCVCVHVRMMSNGHTIFKFHCTNKGLTKDVVWSGAHKDHYSTDQVGRKDSVYPQHLLQDNYGRHSSHKVLDHTTNLIYCYIQHNSMSSQLTTVISLRDKAAIITRALKCHSKHLICR